ncbi:MAG: indolepyruvate oxidoreductase subunit [Thermoleophilia bacterium]|nr:indolepyruvate oxidoreductase subunit [Thermoleophilia bacterium]
MTGTYDRTTAPAVPAATVVGAVVIDEQLVTRVVYDAVIERRAAGVVRPWSALVCGMPDDRTLLVVDWLLLACREAGIVAQAVPLATSDDQPHGMYVEVAADALVEESIGDVPWGAVDLVVAGEHLELMRAIDAGYVDPETTTVVASCRRTFTRVERDVAPQHVLSEREIDATARRASLAYHAFDGPEVAGWYRLPIDAQPGLLLGAVCGTGLTGLDEPAFAAAIDALGIDAELHREAFRRGMRLGRREGGRVRRVKTAYQFTRRRRALVDHRSRRTFEELVARAADLVHAEHLGALQEAIYLLCEFQDAEWASVLVDHVADLARAEREALGVDDVQLVDPHGSIVPDAIRALAAMLVWPDAAWIANRKRSSARIKGIRTGFGLTRRDAFQLVDHVPLDALDLAAARSPRMGAARVNLAVAPLLQPLRVERIETTSVRGALRLRRLAASAARRSGTPRQRLELDTAETWLEAMHDSLRSDHALARIVARSGTIVQGAGAVREANRATAHAFWGRIVRQSLAIDRAAGTPDVPGIAHRVVPFAWEQLCRSGPLALWEYAAQVLGIALAHSRGMAYEQALGLADALCEPRRPVEGR